MIRVVCPGCYGDAVVDEDDRECGECGREVPTESIERAEAQWSGDR